MVVETKHVLLILSAPSGAGKTTVVQRFVETNPGWKQVLTCTTRKPRLGEIDGKDYRFINETAFDRLVYANRFLEFATVHGHFYGTLISDVESVWSLGYNAVLVIDTQGKELVKTELPSAITVFLLPPSNEDLERRLRGRKTESETVIQERLHQATSEIKDAYTYDHVIVNRNIDETVRALQDIIKS